jgi:UDP-glucose 4-epimerase
MERLAELYSSLYDIKTIGLRLFNVYGNREEHKGSNASIITQFIEQLSAGIEPVVYGDGRQTRDFIHVDDVVEALMLCMKTKLKGSNILNIGTGTNYSFNDIVDFIGESLNIEVTPVYQKLAEKNYVYHSMADMELTKKLLGFKSKISAIDGIKKIIAFGLYKGLFKEEGLFEQ